MKIEKWLRMVLSVELKIVIALVCFGVMGCNITFPKIDIPSKPPVTPTTTTTTIPPVTPVVDVSGPIVDPPYDQAYMDSHGSFEECGLEAQLKIISRACVIRPGNGYWMLSSPFLDKLRRDSNNNGVLQDCVVGGTAYHVKGYAVSEPRQNEIETMPLVKAGKYIVVESRRAL